MTRVTFQIHKFGHVSRFKYIVYSILSEENQLMDIINKSNSTSTDQNDTGTFNTLIRKHINLVVTVKGSALHKANLIFFGRIKKDDKVM